MTDLLVISAYEPLEGQAIGGIHKRSGHGLVGCLYQSARITRRCDANADAAFVNGAFTVACNSHQTHSRRCVLNALEKLGGLVQK